MLYSKFAPNRLSDCSKCSDELQMFSPQQQPVPAHIRAVKRHVYTNIRQTDAHRHCLIACLSLFMSTNHIAAQHKPDSDLL